MKILKGVGKVAIAGILSIMILSLFMCCYILLPVHIENEKGNTDFVWPANSVWVRATEGIAWGRFDANGYNNLSVVENPNIIVLGSSHMEACNVMQDQTAACLLADKLSGGYTVYNVGISGHHFFKVCQYIPANLELYDETPKAVVIETSTVDVRQENVDQVLTGTVAYTPSHSTGLIGTLQRIPFLRRAYHQVESGLLKLFMPSSGGSETEGAAADEDASVSAQGGHTVDEKAYVELFDYLSKIERKYGTQIIIFYHPTGTINTDGTIAFQRGDQLAAFKQSCEDYGINYIDMTSSFEEMYYNDHHVAHGFATGKLETGHLNAYGHAAVADALYEEIEAMEEAGELCQ